MNLTGISGCGLGLRREFLHDLAHSPVRPDWLEITPENWVNMPYQYRQDFQTVTRQYKIIAHGVSLSLGSPDPLDSGFLRSLKKFFLEHGIRYYSEHLSFSNFNGRQTYELLPIPMTFRMVDFISDKIKKVCDTLGFPLILENVSYYYIPFSEMTEVEFINRILDNTNCPLLLDINNIYVNSVNHRFSATEFIQNLDLSKVAYIHTAGHTYYEDDNMIIDTHGSPVTRKVWDLLEFTLNLISVPVMIERDNNIPPWSEMLKEFSFLKNIAYPYYNTRQTKIG